MTDKTLKETQDALEDAMKLLRSLCFDRGVVLYASCVSDSRDAYRDLCWKHNLFYGVDSSVLHRTDGVEVRLKND